MTMRVLTGLLTLAIAAPALAQIDRYELGLRLRQFERRLAASDDPGRRSSAFAELNRAVQAFFRLDTQTVAKAIDAADAALDGADPPLARRFAKSLQLRLRRRLVEPGATPLSCTLSAAYRLEQEFDSSDLQLAIQLPGAAEPVRRPLDEMPTTLELPLDNVPEGDHLITWTISQGEHALVTRQLGLSVATDVSVRLAALTDFVALRKKQAKATNPTTPTIESTTLPALCKLLRGMQRRRPAETVLPGNRLLAEAEALSASMSKPSKQPFYAGHRAGSFWLRVPVAGQPVTARLYAPESPQGKRPIVVALHGAGGSENLFFDGYGDGRILELAKERGWFVVAPRVSLSGVACADLAAALAERYAIDPEQTLLIGHSMGAMQAVKNAVSTPARFRAVAALGGGGRVPRSAVLDSLPFFIGAGSRDFAFGTARALHRSVEARGADSTWRKYEDVEHLAIVQIALPDVFAFFDKILAR